MADQENTISYDKLKEQLEKEIYSFLEATKSLDEIPFPVIAFEKGKTNISYSLPHLTESVLFDCVELMKKHLAHIRIHSFESGYYSFQALNKNLFKTDNLLENYKIEFYLLSSGTKCEISKTGNLTQEEINCSIELFKRSQMVAQEDPIKRLRKLGASVLDDNKFTSWDYIAGYEEVKRKMKESIVLPLKSPEIYDTIAQMTRKIVESNRPRAILFDGAPGVGKTTAARIIAGEVHIPLVYVPVESIMSKWYGQSSQNLSQIFDACEDMGGAIIFLDEIDSLAGSRDQNMFEATRRILSVLLRRLDGIDSAANTITIGATNRKNDLDHALLSRFDQIIHFPLPNAIERSSIFSNYAKHLSDEDCAILGEKSESFSGRNIKDVCELTERRWARKIMVKKEEPSPPSFDYYKQAISQWKQTG